MPKKSAIKRQFAPDRACVQCGAIMTIRRWEKPNEHLRRRHCSQKCAGASQSRDPASVLAANLAGISSRGCWEWIGHRDPRGYGRFCVKASREVLAHRLAWVVHRGPIPDGMHVLHHCDNPPCCNPDHLYLGTNADNVRDRVERDRGQRLTGETNPKARLTEDQVRAIRRDLRSQSAIAATYGIVQGTVSAIKRRRAWRHVASEDGQ